MGVPQAAGAAAGLFALLHWLIVPRLRASMPRRLSPKAVARVSALLVAELLRSAALVSTVTLGLIALIVGLAPRLPNEMPPGGLAEFFRCVRTAREWLEQLDATWGIGLVLLLAVALVIALRREARSRINAATSDALSRLRAQAGGPDGLPRLSDTDEMKAVRERLAQCSELLGGEHAGKLEPAAKERLIAETAALERLLVQLDVSRRLDLSPGLERLARPTPQGSQLGSFIISSGVLRSVSFSSRMLAVASLILLPAALITCESSALAAAAQASETRLHDLIVAYSIKEAEEGWEHLLPPVPAAPPLSPEDQSTVQQTSHGFAQAFGAQLGNSKHFEELSRKVASLTARQQVLESYSVSRHQHDLAVRSGEKESEQLAKAAIAMADGQAPNIAEEQARTILEPALRGAPPEMRRGFRTRVQHFMANARMSMQSGEIAEMLFTETLNVGAASVAAANGASSAVHQFATTLAPPGDLQERIGKLLHLSILQFLTAIGTSGPVPAFDRIGTVPATTDAEAAEVARAAERLEEQVTKWSEAPPSLYVATATVAGEAAARRELAELLQRDVPMLDAWVPGWREDLPDALADMPDYFPGHAGDEIRTARFRFADSLPRFRPATESLRRTIAENFLRARNFAALRGFGRIGGVLIGIETDARQAPALSDLHWSDSADGIRLQLVRAVDGSVLNFGPFRAPILTAALAYAADGRPITATMPLAEPFGRKVMLHPALVDTALGCEARHLDQLADEFTGYSNEREEIDRRIAAHGFFYNLGWALQLGRLLPDRLGQAPSEFAEALKSELRQARELLARDDLDQMWREKLVDAGSWADGRLSPVTQEPAYFDSRLVQEIGSCLAGGPTLERFRACMASTALPQSYIEDFPWFFPPPRFRVESGVRETSEPVGPNLDFLALHQTRRSPIWPLDFVVQVTFDSRPVFSKPGSKDPPPFEFSRDWVDRAVVSNLDSAPGRQLEAQRVVADLREFAVLQRFFRLTFAGAFGESFPLDKLRLLAAVQPHAKPSRIETARWNADPEQVSWLRANGFGPAADALGISHARDVLVDTGDRCPVIRP